MLALVYALCLLVSTHGVFGVPLPNGVPLWAAFVIIAMEQYLAGFGQRVTVSQGAIFVACVLLFRRGLIGEIAHLLKRSL